VNDATTHRVIEIRAQPAISRDDLQPTFVDEHRAMMQEIRLDHQWQLLVDLTGSEGAAADVVAATPFMGIPPQARRILEGRSE
jgi:hypothetical protein